MQRTSWPLPSLPPPALALIGLLAGAAAPTIGVAQTVEVPTFLVGSGVLGGHLQDVDVAPAPDGSFVAIWGSYDLYNLTGNNDHAVTRRFSAAGVPLGAVAQVDTSAHVFNPTISALPSGGYVATWEWVGQDYLFFGQLLDDAGRLRGADFETTLDLLGWPIGTGIAFGHASGPMFLWNEGAALWSRTLDANGDRRGGDVRVGDGGTYRIDAATMADGGIVVTWAGGWDEARTMGRLFGPDGQVRAAKVALSDVIFQAHVAAGPRGGFAIVGFDTDTVTLESALWARHFADDGTPLGPEFPVHVAAQPNSSFYADAEFDVRGNLYVAWTEYKDGQASPPHARAYGPDGVPFGPAVQISDQPGVETRVARLANGSFANVWYWSGQAWGTITRLCAPGGTACGDGVRDPGCEACDEGTANSDSAPDACRSDCTEPRCGDGVVDSGEACDDGNRNGCDGCGPACTVEVGVACGDGVHAGACGEECDDGGANSDVTPDACRADCLDSRCGDGVVDAGEACDDGNQTPCDGCSFDCVDETTLPDTDVNGVADVCDACAAFLAPAALADASCAPFPHPTATAEQAARFAAGAAEFTRVSTPGGGLGPVFNGASCVECHHQPLVGGSSPRTVTRFGTVGANGYSFDPLTALGGSLRQAEGISTATCAVPGEVVPPEATFVSPRDTPALFGLGLIEAIDEWDIVRRADVSDDNNDGISGRAGKVNNRLGRFGWKAHVASLHDFAVEAYIDEMGITTGLASVENAPQGAALACDPAADPEGDTAAIARFTDFLQMLAPPPTVALRDMPRAERIEVRRGRGLFRRIGCQKCHHQAYRTRADFPIAALRNARRLPVYSDFLLHDMGDQLADGIAQGSAGGREFRTAPLWGARQSAPYLHDGRGATLAEAIVAHGGEAATARNGYVALGATEQAALLAFLNSL